MLFNITAEVRSFSSIPAVKKAFQIPPNMEFDADACINNAITIYSELGRTVGVQVGHCTATLMSTN